MVDDFYAKGLREGFWDRRDPSRRTAIERINAAIFEELCRGIVEDSSLDSHLEIMDGLAARGAEGIILGCTETEMPVKLGHHVLPLYDTTLLHTRHAVEWALSGG